MLHIVFHTITIDDAAYIEDAWLIPCPLGVYANTSRVPKT